MIEMEVKIKLKDKEATINTLLQLGALQELRLVQVDRYFNAPRQMPHFRDTDEALRLRSTTEISPSSAAVTNVIHDVTYKGPKLDSIVKSRIEHICNLENPEAMDQILLALQFTKVLTVEKDRLVYKLHYHGYELEVLIDKIEGLDGYFLEAEIMVSEEQDKEESRKILIKLIQDLGYSAQDSILDSYLELILLKKD